MTQFRLSKKYIYELIIKHEISSVEHYNRRLQKPTVPPLNSGITVGIGLDLGHLTRQEITNIFHGKLPSSQVTLLANCARLLGDAARRHLSITPALLSVNIPYNFAADIFFNHTLPKHCAATLRVYRDVVKLHPIEQTAIVGLVFNRGNDVSDTDRRREMRQLITAISQDNDKLMAQRIREMKRLWIGKGANGLLTRRDDEADAILIPDNIVIDEKDLLIIEI